MSVRCKDLSIPDQKPKVKMMGTAAIKVGLSYKLNVSESIKLAKKHQCMNPTPEWYSTEVFKLTFKFPLGQEISRIYLLFFAYSKTY